MAIFPCDLGGHRYPGAQQTIYAATVNGADAMRRKLRLCPEHFEKMFGYLTRNCRSAQAAFDDPTLLACPVCGRLVVDSTDQFFATVYRRGSEREDYWAPVHSECRGAVEAEWRIGVDVG